MKKVWFLNSNFKVFRLACWNESKKDLVRNSGNLESGNSSELAVIFSKTLEVSYKRKVQTCGQLWKPDGSARSWAWSTVCITFLHFPSVSHGDQMKEMKEPQIKYYRSNFFHLGEGNFVEEFCCHYLGFFLGGGGLRFSFSFVFTLHPNNWKDEQKHHHQQQPQQQKRTEEERPSGSFLILLQIYFSANTEVSRFHTKMQWGFGSR